MGFLNTWKVSGITDKKSKAFGPVAYALGVCIATESVSEDLQDVFNDLRYEVVVGFDAIKAYLDGEKSAHDEAVSGLVSLAGIIQGQDGGGFAANAVRHLSQGLYGSMYETPEEFKIHNLPLMLNAMEALDKLQAKNILDTGNY